MKDSYTSDTPSHGVMQTRKEEWKYVQRGKDDRTALFLCDCDAMVGDHRVGATSLNGSKCGSTETAEPIYRRSALPRRELPVPLWQRRGPIKWTDLLGEEHLTQLVP